MAPCSPHWMSIKGFAILLKHVKAVKHSCRWSERVKVEKESLRHEATPRLGRDLTAGPDRIDHHR
ncbi:MAG: hypothetical protein NTAFB01_24060 [Nitrospira sp.]